MPLLEPTYTEILQEILEEHYHEIVGLVALLLSVLSLRLALQTRTPSAIKRAKGPVVRAPQPLPLIQRRNITMPAASPQTVKLKSTLRLLIPRLRNAQKKDTALSITSRREMADLLSQSREASARIRVENIIATDITVELMEILELYAELLLARAGLLDVRDKNIKEGLIPKDSEGEATGLEEAAASLIYAAPRLARDIKELGVVRAMLIERFGKEFAVKAQENEGGTMVPERVTEKLRVEPPSGKLVQAYLEAIARAYGVEWPPISQQLQQAQDEVDEEDQDDDGVGDEGGAREQPILAAGQGHAQEQPSTPKTRQTGTQPRDLSIGPLPPSGQPNAEGSQSPVQVAPPGARSNDPNPKVRLPGGGQVKPKTQAVAAHKVDAKAAGPLGPPPTVDDLSARFKALKR